MAVWVSDSTAFDSRNCPDSDRLAPWRIRELAYRGLFHVFPMLRGFPIFHVFRASACSPHEMAFRVVSSITKDKGFDSGPASAGNPERTW